MAISANTDVGKHPVIGEVERGCEPAMPATDAHEAKKDMDASPKERMRGNWMLPADRDVGHLSLLLLRREWRKLSGGFVIAEGDKPASPQKGTG